MTEIRTSDDGTDRRAHPTSAADVTVASWPQLDRPPAPPTAAPWITTAAAATPPAAPPRAPSTPPPATPSAPPPAPPVPEPPWAPAPPPPPLAPPKPPMPPEPPAPPAAGGGGVASAGPKPPRRRRSVAATGALVVASLVAGSAGGWFAAGARDDDSGTPTTTPATPASVRLSGDTMDAAAIVAALQSSVVSIETRVVAQRGPFTSEGTGAGTGIVLDDDGNILTNAHVVAGARSVTVTLAGETKARTAEVVGTDTDNDVAVLHVDDADGLVPAHLATGSGQAVQVGDDVVAIGNALALEGGMTVTQGIVSATDRQITDENGTLSGLIQTDAAISSGNSGGPLVNAKGEVVGMNTAVAASGGGVEASNIGFVIPITTATSIAHDLLGTTT